MRKSISFPIAPPLKLRRRKSLQDTKQSHSFSFTNRRVERQSSRPRLTSMQSMEQTLLDYVHVEFVKAVVPGQNKLASPRYVMRITNTMLDQTWEMARTFKEFYELKEAIVSLLDYGHFCSSNCPWLYMYAAHHFPRRRIFRSRSPSVISRRISDLQTYFSTLLRMAKHNRNLECSISSTKLPQLIYDFLFEGMVFDRSDFQRLSERPSMGGRDSSFLDNDPTQEAEGCSICQQPLVGDSAVSIAPAGPYGNNCGRATSSGNRSRAASSGKKRVMAGLTTLDCGHCFHDECILVKLNESLKCPLCVAYEKASSLEDPIAGSAPQDQSRGRRHNSICDNIWDALHLSKFTHRVGMKRGVRNQEVTDAQGRRRFHGAFTGGFSAGYFNSVGTKEGWTPSTFSSSRENRSSRFQQRAEDFMDEEDDPLLGKRLETTERYDTLQTGAKRRLQQAAGAGSAGGATIPGFALPDDWMLPVNDSIGASLLKQMGWKEGHGIGQRVRKRKFHEESQGTKKVVQNANEKKSEEGHCCDAEEEVYVPPRKVFDVQKAFPKPKLDRYGAGFDPYTNAPEFARYKQQQEDKQQVQQGSHRQIISFADAMQTTSGSNRATTAYGLSALEENDDVDVYGSVSMTEFDRVIAPLGSRSNIKRLDSSAQESRRHEKVSRSRTLCSDGCPVLPGFELATAREKPPKSVHFRLAVPSGFKGYHRFKEDDGYENVVTTLYRQHHLLMRNGAFVTAKLRGIVLGDQEEEEATLGENNANVAADRAHLGAAGSTGSVFDLLDNEQKAKLLNAAAQAKQKLLPQTLPLSTLAADEKIPAPKSRQHLVHGSGGEDFRATISASIAKRFVSSNATAEEKSTEPNRFRATQAKVSRRSQSLWIPKSLLCKRFHVKCVGPTSSSGKEGENDKKRDLFDEELVPHLVEFAASRSTRSQPEEKACEGTMSTVDDSNKRVNDEELPPLPATVKAPSNLLKSIFEPSDESAVSESDSDDSDDDAGTVQRSERTNDSLSSLHVEDKEVDGAVALRLKSLRSSNTSDESSSSEDDDMDSVSVAKSNGEDMPPSKKRLHSDDDADHRDSRKEHKKHKKHRSSRSDKDKKHKKSKKRKEHKERKGHKHRSSRHSRRSRSESVERGRDRHRSRRH